MSLELTNVVKTYREPDGNILTVLDIERFQIASAEQVVLVGSQRRREDVAPQHHFGNQHARPRLGQSRRERDHATSRSRPRSVPGRADWLRLSNI